MEDIHIRLLRQFSVAAVITAEKPNNVAYEPYSFESSFKTSMARVTQLKDTADSRTAFGVRFRSIQQAHWWTSTAISTQ
jgi:hypothetical protein